MNYLVPSGCRFVITVVMHRPLEFIDIHECQVLLRETVAKYSHMRSCTKSALLVFRVNFLHIYLHMAVVGTHGQGKETVEIRTAIRT